MSYIDIIKKRRSVYALSSDLNISKEEIAKLVSDIAVESPSAFNMQSSRAIVLFGDEHKKLWNIVSDTLKAIVPAEKFADTKAKMDSFSAGAGSILFFEDDSVVNSYKEKFASYASAFDMFAAHGLGIFQGNVWNALAELGIGASLQHYNPLIDEAVKKEWKVPESCRLVSQMVFGKIESAPAAIEKLPASERVRVIG